ncbi:MAG: hypothetical protein IH609_00605 [Dehalococcoidia bacterium]|nr:hypothetical protein [Dehalococcoidia bacterium]
MSRGSRLALVILAVVLMLAPAAALHPVVAHLYAAGLSNLWTELTHPPVLVVLLIAMASVLPATGFIEAMVRAGRGMPHLQALMRNSQPGRMETFDYRVLPSDAVLVFTAGLFRPVTFVSAGAERALGAAGLRAALLHEEAHRRSQDVMWRLLLRAIGRGFAFVPWINGMVESETLRTECAADDYAIRGGARRLDLFEAIVAVLPPPDTSMAVGLTDADVELRLTRLVHPDLPLPGRPARSLLALAVVVALPTVAAHAVAISAVAGTSHLM